MKAFGNSVSWKHELLRGLRGQLGTSAPHSITKPPVYSGLKYHFGATQKLSCSFWRLLAVSGVLQKEKPGLKEGDSHRLGSLGNHPTAWSHLRIYSEHLLDPARKSTALCTLFLCSPFWWDNMELLSQKKTKPYLHQKKRQNTACVPPAPRREKDQFFWKLICICSGLEQGWGGLGRGVSSKQCLQSPWIKVDQVFWVNVGHIPGVGPWRGSDPDWGTLKKVVFKLSVRAFPEWNVLGKRKSEAEPNQTFS